MLASQHAELATGAHKHHPLVSNRDTVQQAGGHHVPACVAQAALVVLVEPPGIHPASSREGKGGVGARVGRNDRGGQRQDSGSEDGGGAGAFVPDRVLRRVRVVG